MEVTNRICPYCGKGNVWYLDQTERGNKNDLYCRECYMRFSDSDTTAVEIRGTITAEEPQAVKGSNVYRTKKERLAVQALDLFTKTFCIKENEDDLEFECKNCEFQLTDGTCLVKKFASKHVPEYRNFGSMGELQICKRSVLRR